MTCLAAAFIRQALEGPHKDFMLNGLFPMVWDTGALFVLAIVRPSMLKLVHTKPAAGPTYMDPWCLRFESKCYSVLVALHSAASLMSCCCATMLHRRLSIHVHGLFSCLGFLCAWMANDSSPCLLHPCGYVCLVGRPCLPCDEKHCFLTMVI